MNMWGRAFLFGGLGAVALSLVLRALDTRFDIPWGVEVAAFWLFFMALGLGVAAGNRRAAAAQQDSGAGVGD